MRSQLNHRRVGVAANDFECVDSLSALVTQGKCYNRGLVSREVVRFARGKVIPLVNFFYLKETIIFEFVLHVLDSMK